MLQKARKIKVCFPIMNRVHYARQKHLLGLLKSHPKIDLQVVVGGSALIPKYGNYSLKDLESHLGSAPKLFNNIEGGNHIAMAKTASLVGLDFANLIYQQNPDLVLIRGDRFEQLAIAMVAAYSNKAIAHIEGGDLSGTIDESVRHAITKLSHIHFVTNEASRRRVIKMGENPATVFNVGSLDIEFAGGVSGRYDGSAINQTGMGAPIDVKKDFLTVMQHPVTTESHNKKNIEITLEAIDAANMPTVWFWPNSDAGTDEMAKAIRLWRENGKLKNKNIRFVTDISPEDFIGLLRSTACLVGNSSAGIKEASYLGTPVINIGTRQAGRLKASNVMDVGYSVAEIKSAIKKQLGRGRYPSSKLYYQPGASRRIIEILSKASLATQKKFYG